MKPRHVIYLTGSGATLYTWTAGRYQPASGYALPGGDPGPMVACLALTPSAVVAIVVDVLEEEHTRDTIAKLGRRDQAALLARKLARAFPRTAYRTAAVQGRAPDDPQTQRILLSGLTRADHLQALQEQLAAARLPVASVCSPALLSRPLLDRLRPAQAAGATLLVSRQREGSLRLTFFRERDLVGSRLIRPALAAAPGDIAALLRQLDESVRYFDAAFAPSAGNPVDVILFCEDDIDRSAAMAAGTGHEGYRLEIPEPGAAGRKLGLPGPLAPGDADLVFVELLRRYPPTGNFAPVADRAFFQLHQLRVAGKAACLALSAAALLGTTLNSVAMLEAAIDTEDARKSAAELGALLAAAADEPADTTTDPLEMQRAVTAWRELTRRDVDPGAILGLVSKALERQPRIALDGVEWSPAASLPAPAADTGTDAPDGSMDNGDADAQAAPDDGLAGGPSTPWSRLRIRLKGRVEPFGGDYRLAFAEVDAFMQTLRTDPRVVAVEASRQPLDIRAQATQTGEVSPALAADPAAFTVDLLVSFSHDPA